MSFPASIGSLPIEVLSLIIDRLDIQQLLTFSHVCKAFNTVARSHRLFWRDIRLAAVSDSALELFQARINREPARRIRITLRLQGHHSCDGITSVVLPAVTRNLSRVTQLGLYLHSTVSEATISALCHHVPLLESLELRFAHSSEDRPAVTLSSELFSGECCSRLKDLWLSNVAFPAQSIPAFERLRSVVFHFSYRCTIPLNWFFEHLPELRALSILGASYNGVDFPSGGTVAMAPPRLWELQLWLSPPDYEPIFESVRNVASLKRILCGMPRNSFAHQLTSHLRGSLELHFLCLIDGMIHMRLYERESDRARTLAVRAKDLPEDLPRDVLFAPHLLDRIVTLRLFARLAYLVPHLPELPRCDTLEVILEAQDSVPTTFEITTPLRLPELRAVLVGPSVRGLIEVQAEQLRELLSQLLGVRSNLPTLELVGVSLAGNRDALFSDFKEL